MGVFHDMVEVVNRTSERLEIMFDGQREFLAPNYTPDGKLIEGVHNMVPRQVIPFALNQTCIPGSEDALDVTSFRSFIGVIDKKERKPKSWHDISFIDKRSITEVTRVSEEAINEELIADPTYKTQRGGGRHRVSAAREGLRATAPFDLKEN